MFLFGFLEFIVKFSLFQNVASETLVDISDVQRVNEFDDPLSCHL